MLQLLILLGRRCPGLWGALGFLAKRIKQVRERTSRRAHRLDRHPRSGDTAWSELARGNAFPSKLEREAGAEGLSVRIHLTRRPDGGVAAELTRFVGELLHERQGHRGGSGRFPDSVAGGAVIVCLLVDAIQGEDDQRRRLIRALGIDEKSGAHDGMRGEGNRGAILRGGSTAEPGDSLCW